MKFEMIKFANDSNESSPIKVSHEPVLFSIAEAPFRLHLLDPDNVLQTYTLGVSQSIWQVQLMQGQKKRYSIMRMA